MTQLITRKKTYFSISIFRLIGILSILIGHSVWIIYNKWMRFWCLTGDPRDGFMVLSGLLYANKKIDDIKKFYVKSAGKLLLPLLEAIIFLLLANIISMAATNNWDFVSVWIGYTNSTGEKIIQFANWYFIFWTAFSYIFLPLLDRWDKKYSQIVILLLVIINVAVVCFIYPGLKLFFPAFVLGYFLGKKKWKDYFDSKVDYKYFRSLTIWIILLAFSLGLISLVVYGERVYLVDVVSVFAESLFGIASFFVLVLSLQPLTQKIANSRFLLWTDKICYFIFIYNQCWGVGGTDVRRWCNSTGGCIALFITLAIMIAIIMCYLDKFIRSMWIKIKSQREKMNSKSL